MKPRRLSSLLSPKLSVALAAVGARVRAVLHRKHNALVGVSDGASFRSRLNASLLGQPVVKSITRRPAVFHQRTRGARAAYCVAVPRVLTRRRATGTVVGARVNKGTMPGVAKQATFKPGNQARAEAVDERDVVRLANHVPNLPLVVLGLLGEERGLNDGGEVLGEDAVSAAWVRGLRGEG